MNCSTVCIIAINLKQHCCALKGSKDKGLTHPPDPAPPAAAGLQTGKHHHGTRAESGAQLQWWTKIIKIHFMIHYTSKSSSVLPRLMFWSSGNPADYTVGKIFPATTY